MGSAYIPSQNFTNITVGTITNFAGAVLLLEIGGITYPNGYRISYNGGFRNFYPTLGSSGEVIISCHSVAYGEDLPDYTLPSSTRVLVINTTAQIIAAVTNLTVTNVVTSGTLPAVITTITWTPSSGAVKYAIYRRKYVNGVAVWEYLKDSMGLNANYIMYQGTGVTTTITFTTNSGFINYPADSTVTDVGKSHAIKVVPYDEANVEGTAAYAYFTI